MEKEKYIVPEMEIVQFNVDDIIATSEPGIPDWEDGPGFEDIE